MALQVNIALTTKTEHVKREFSRRLNGYDYDTY